jgi:hypothetical protein
MNIKSISSQNRTILDKIKELPLNNFPLNRDYTLCTKLPLLPSQLKNTMKLRVNYPCFDEKPHLRIKHKVDFGDNPTSQGEIYIGTITVDSTDLVVLLKCSRVTLTEYKTWITNFTKLRDSHVGEKYVIHPAFMDAIAAQMVSSLYENNVSPHFPFVYANHLFPQNKDMKEVLIMEYLPLDLIQEMKRWCFVDFYFSIFIQIAAAILCYQEHCNMTHNDLHASNIRMRKVDYHSSLHYRFQKKDVDGSILSELHFKVPTFGYEVVIIDFGRANIGKFYKYEKENKDAWIELQCTLFQLRQTLQLLEPSHPSFDFIRFMISIDDLMGHLAENDPTGTVKDFTEMVFKNAVDKDVMQMIWDIPKYFKTPAEQDDAESYYVENVPRKICTLRLCEIFEFFADRNIFLLGKDTDTNLYQGKEYNITYHEVL